jgi:uncharacterized membrane protein YfcA
VSWWTYPVLLLAGLGAGITASAAGMSSLVSYPVLLAVGLPPLTANVTNTVALVFSGLGAVSSSRAELAGQSRALRPGIAASIGGGVVGSILLLSAPASTFRFVVPWLIAGASAAILPRDSGTAGPGRHQRSALLAGTFLIGIYGGYFGAAAGVLMLALVLTMTADALPRANAAKNVLCASYNIIAALTFILLGPVDWLAVLPLAAGFLAGGRLGPMIVRTVPPRPLRITTAIAGIGLAAALAWQTYH